MGEDKEQAHEVRTNEVRPTTDHRAREPLTSVESLAGRLNSQAIDQFSVFYREHTPRLVAFLLMQGAPEALAAELVQGVMIDLWRRWGTVDTPKAWTKTAATRAWIRYRSSVPELPMDIPAESPLLRRHNDDTGEQTDEIHVQHDLLLLLAMLPDQQRHVMARTYDDSTAAEIAAELGIAESTVRATIRDARRSLRRYRGQTHR